MVVLTHRPHRRHRRRRRRRLLRLLLQFDHSGKFLAIGSCEIAVHETKGWGKLVGFAEPNSNLTGVGFGAKAESIAGSSDAGVVKLYGPA